jgi:hypothetical protein
MNNNEEVMGMSIRSFRPNVPRSTFAPVLLALFCLASLAPARPGSSAPAGQGEPAFASWQVLSESRDEALYQLFLEGSVVEGLELRWFATGSGGNRNNDYAEIKLYNAIGQLVGRFRYGREGDNRDSVTGWHAAYMVLPQRAVVSKAELFLHQPGGSPRLAISFSWAKPWNAGVDMQYYPLSYEGRVFASGLEALPRGKVWLHAVWPPWPKSAIDYVVWKSFTKPAPPSGFEANPDVYVDASYVGTINTIGEGWTGQGGYAIAVQAGVGQGSWIRDALHWGRKQCLYKAVSHTPEGYIQDVMQNEASGITDIFLDVVDATLLSYIKFALECVQLVATLDVDEKVAKAQTVVFENVPLQGNNRIHAWIRLKGVVAALGLAHSVASFYTDGTIEGDLNGNRGIEVGGILLHYRGPSSPEVTGTVPGNGAVNLSLRPELKIAFSQNIILNNQANVVLHKAGATQAISCTIVASGNTLTIKPNQDLEGNTAYELEIKPDAVKARDSLTNLASYTLRFTTGAPFMIESSSPSDGEVNVPLDKTTTILVFNKQIAQKGDANPSIVLKDASGRVVARVGQGADCTFYQRNANLVLSSSLLPLAAGQRYTWEIPRDAFRDALGNPNQPAKFTFTTAPPVQVVATIPKNNDTDVPSQPITVCFSQRVVPGTNYNGITLKVGNTNVNIRKSFSGNKLTVESPSGLGYNKKYVLTIPEGAMKDPTTGAPSAAYTLSFASAVPPAVVSTTPVNNATGVYRDQAIVLTFSEPIKWPSVPGDVVKAGSVLIPCHRAIEANELILTPTNPLPANTTITVSLPARAVHDLNDTPNQSPYSFSFTTGISGSPPRVAWTSPADGETGVSLNQVVYVRFTKNVQPGPNWGNITLKTEGGQDVGVNAVISYGNQLELRPTGQLKKNTVYVITLPAGCVKEELGSLFEGPVVFRFRTQYLSGPYQPQ